MGRPASFKIVLSGQEFEIKPFTLRRLQDLEAVLLGSARQTNLEISKSILSLALKQDHPAAAEGLDEMETTVPEIASAVKIITDEAGFVQAKPGEAQAA